MAIDELRMLGFGLTYAFSTCAILLAAFFFSRLRRARQTSKELFPFMGLTLLAAVTGVANIITSWFDYFRWEQGLFLLNLWEIYASMQVIVILAIVFVMEYVSKKTKYLVSLYLLVGLFPSLFFHDFDLENLILIIVGLPAIALIAPLYYITFVRPTKGYLRRRLLIAFLGVLNFIIANFLRSSSLEPALGTENFLVLYCIGTLIMISGVILLGYGFAAFSTFTDIMWKEKLRELYVVSPTGTCLYAFSFETKTTIQNTQLVAGGMLGIQGLLSECVRTTGTLSNIEYKSLTILLEKGKGISAVLVLKEPSTYLQYKLKEFLAQFLAFFEVALRSAQPTPAEFAPTKALVEKSFEK